MIDSNSLLPIVTGLYIAVLSSCSTICWDVESNISSKCDDGRPCKVDVSLNSLSAYDTLYIISGPRFSDEIHKIIGVDYSDMLPDGSRTYIYVKDRAILEEFRSSCRDVSIGAKAAKGRGYLTIPYGDNLYAKVRSSEAGNSYYLVLKP